MSLRLTADTTQALKDKTDMQGHKIKTNSPAVTSVEECTKLDTGVGALIANGSQEQKGNWADLVTIAEILKKTNKRAPGDLFLPKKDQEYNTGDKALMLMIKPTVPTIK